MLLFEVSGFLAPQCLLKAGLRSITGTLASLPAGGQCVVMALDHMMLM